MVRKCLAPILALVLLSTTLLPAHGFAQSQGLTNEEKAELTGTRKQLATIVFAGLAGAILGLSTLSFYGRPQDHLSNIAIGGALGVICGAAYTTYKAARNPYEAYDLNASEKFKGFDSREDVLARVEAPPPPLWGWQWSF